MLLKPVRFLYRLVSKIIYLILPLIFKILLILRLQSRVINQFNKLRHDVHKTENHKNLILKLLQNNKLIALDVGAQGGFFNSNMFSDKYNSFFQSIVVEPLEEEANKLIAQNHKVIPKGLWSTECKKKLYVLGNRLGSSSMFKPSRDAYDLYNFKKKDFSSFNITKEINVDCNSIKDGLEYLNIKYLDFLKIDTQGAELEILKGLGNYKPLLMKIEAQVVPMYEKVPYWSELLDYLYKTNYMTCEWTEIGPHITRSPVEMDMIFIPNYLTEEGKKLILSKEKEFISLMLIFGHIKLLQTISEKLNFLENEGIKNIKDKFFH